jgi:hypothetical protein
MQHIAVDSYGKCLHNAEFPAHEERVFGSTKLPLFARYQFALALENSLAHDYVTEKFYQPLIAGAVPIYLGVSLSLSLARALSRSFSFSLSLSLFLFLFLFLSFSLSL